MLPFLVVIRNLDIIRIAFGPSEADTPLFVDPDAELTLAISLQALKSIPRWHTQVLQRIGAVKDEQLPESRRNYRCGEPTGAQPLKNPLCLPVAEAPNHRMP